MRSSRLEIYVNSSPAVHRKNWQRDGEARSIARTLEGHLGNKLLQPRLGIGPQDARN